MSQMTTSELILPWEINREAIKWNWAVNYLRSRSMPSIIWKRPGNAETEEKIKKLFLFLFTTRNWVLCFCKSPSYMRMLYSYLEAMWVIQTNTFFEEIEVGDLFSIAYGKDPEKEDSLKTSSLLVMPYGQVPYSGVEQAGSSVASSILIKRKIERKPLIADLLVSTSCKLEDCQTEVRNMIDLYGELAVDLFFGSHVKYVYVDVPKVKDKEGEDAQQRVPG